MPKLKIRKLPRVKTLAGSSIGAANANLIACLACGRHYSRAAAACPGCGHPNPNKQARAIAMNDCRSRGVYVCLALFLGFLGIHNFYAGRILRGILELLGFPILAVFCMIGAASSISSLNLPPLIAFLVPFLWILLPTLILVLEMLFTTKDVRGVPMR